MKEEIVVEKGMIIFKSRWRWEVISKKLIEEYGYSIMISWKSKKELGFVKREFSYYDPNFGFAIYDIRLDFYDESAQSWFQLKYL